MNILNTHIVKQFNLEYFILSLILLFALFVRLYKINTPLADWHSWRQVDTASVSKKFVLDGIDILKPKYHDISLAQTGVDNPKGYRLVEMPIFNFVHSTAFKVVIRPGNVTDSVESVEFLIVGRFVSIFASLGSIVALFYLGRRFISTSGGLLASFFYAFLPFNIYFTRVILPEPLAVFLALCTICFFVSYFDNTKLWKLILSSLFFALSILVKPFTIFYGIALIFYAYDKDRKFFKNIRLWFFLVLSVAPLVLWRIWISNFPEGIPHTAWAFNSDGIRFRPAFWRWIIQERLARLILGTAGIIPFVFGIISTDRKRYFTQALLFSMFVFVSVFATASVRHDYYQTIAIPAICLVLAVGAVSMWNQNQFNKYVTRATLVLSIIFMIGFSWYEVRGMYNINNPSIVVAGRAVREITKSLDHKPYIIAPYNKDTAFLYQTGHDGWPYMQENIDKMIEMGATHYVSVNFDRTTIDLMARFRVLEKTNEYVIIDLGEVN